MKMKLEDTKIAIKLEHAFIARMSQNKSYHSNASAVQTHDCSLPPQRVYKAHAQFERPILQSGRVVISTNLSIQQC